MIRDFPSLPLDCVLTNRNAATTISAASQPEVHPALVDALRRYVPDEPPDGSAAQAVQLQPATPMPPTIEVQRAQLLDE